ncbi:Transcription factor VIP1 [Frankliniella fusca]|uniref:Transcription factor VIP1 n=1 Tax=Frankliniella fusca TaxID=407009 RepID=A0AAE1HNW7_9NEOP|nr:Transcription factor VIP1 [Frankliniella fusca]
MKWRAALTKLAKRAASAMPSVAPCGSWTCGVRRACVWRVTRHLDPEAPCCLRGENLSLKRKVEEKNYQLDYVESRFHEQSAAFKELEKEHRLLQESHQTTLRVLADLLARHGDLVRLHEEEVQHSARLAACVQRLQNDSSYISSSVSTSTRSTPELSSEDKITL